MVKTVGIRPVRLDEVGRLKKIAEQTFTETFGHDNSPEQLQTFFEEAYAVPVLESELKDPDTEVDFILVNDQIAGYLKLNWNTSQTEQVLDQAMEIQRIYILQDFQGQGLGKVAFDYALEAAEASQVDWVWLGVWEHNDKAQTFYAKYGFEKFSEHSFAVGDKIDTDWLMRKDMR
ncbi:ribosomal protein S18 acetylase RimI-like enzyme [Streptococcus rupicaprae]|uniref:Ribosomal protein S18 acetylase RimI-like enzyme n=1 Tax=Streptococcus rupicaprae TaxID=759619 RepID=A0ABV2FHX6_9STRE